MAAPLNPAYTTQEVAFYLDDTKSSILLCPAGTFSSSSPPATLQAAREHGVTPLEIVFDPRASDGKGGISLRDEKGRVLPSADGDAIRTPQEEDTALVLHTSGTTGRPKAVPLSHANLVATMRNIVKTYDLTPKDRTFLVMPL